MSEPALGGVAEPAAPPDPLVQLCAFRVGDEEYVIDLMRVRAIIHPVHITRVPRAPSFIEGVVNLRGAIVPMVDLRRRLGVPPAAATAKTKFIVCSVGGRRVGLVADAVTEVLRIPRSSIKPAPALLAGDGPRFFMGLCGSMDRLKLLLNVKALLTSPAPVPDVQVRAEALLATQG